MPSRPSPLACIAAVLLLAGAAAAGHPPVRPKTLVDVKEVCVDMGAMPPGVDPECRAVTVRELYELVCGPLDVCIVQAVLNYALDSTCTTTGQACGWREEACLADVFGCGPVSRVEQALNGADDFVLYPRGWPLHP